MKDRIELLEGNITKALTKLALPIMATSLIQMAYNMIDMIWIGRVGAFAVTAVGTASFSVWFGKGIAQMPKIGGQVKLGQAIGARQHEKASRIISVTFQIMIFFTVLYIALLTFFNHEIIGFFNLNSIQTIKAAENYLRIISFGIVFSFFNMVVTGLLTASGNSKSPFRANTIGLMINIILDPILIFGLLGFDSLGVEGAAIATVFAQGIVSLVFLRELILDKTIFIDINLLKLLPLENYNSVLKIGVFSSIQTMGFSTVSMIIARFVANFGDTAIAIQRVGSNIESISWMTADGFAASLNAFIAQNYGNKDLDRCHRGYRSGLKIMALWGIFTTIFIYFGSPYIFQLFLPDPSVLNDGVVYLKIVAISQLFMCVEIITGGAFSGYGNTKTPSAISFIFTVARLPMAYVLVELLNSVIGIWWAITMSSIIKGLLTFTLFIIYERKISQNFKKDFA